MDPSQHPAASVGYQEIAQLLKSSNPQILKSSDSADPQILHSKDPQIPWDPVMRSLATEGVMPNARRNDAVKWLWLE